MAARVTAGKGSKTGDELGICTSAFGHRNALSVGKLKELEAAGLGWCEFSALQEQHLDVFDVERVGELAAGIERMKLRVWSIHAPFCGLSMDDADTRADGARRLLGAARLGQRVGARLVVVHPGRDVPSVNRKREERWLSEGLARVAEALPGGMRLALETMGVKSLAGPAEEMLSVLEPLRGGPVGICFDTGHVNQGDDVFGYLRAVSGRVIAVHLHDNHGDRDAHAMPGEGNIRWPECLRALRAAGYEGPWMAETGPKSGTVGAFLKTLGQRMRRYLGAARGVEGDKR